MDTKMKYSLLGKQRKRDEMRDFQSMKRDRKEKFNMN